MKLMKGILTLLSMLAPVALLYFDNSVSGASLGIALALYCLATVVHSVAHECGHFVGGCLSGYRLLCLQLGPMKIIRNAEKKLKLRWKASIGGQCIMIPKQRETPAFKAYNLGGIAANLLVTGLSLLLLLCGSFYATLLAVALVGIGVKKSLINLIPHAAKSGPNDGYVVKLLSGKPAVQRDYAVYLALYEKLFLGEPILPQDYQYLREEASEERELLYYNEIRDILRSVEAETV